MNWAKLGGYFERAIRVWRVCYLLLLIGGQNAPYYSRRPEVLSSGAAPKSSGKVSIRSR